MENRVLILAPRGRDAEVIQAVLEAHGVKGFACADGVALLRELNRDAAAAIVTEEVLGDGFDLVLGAWLADQPPWSDFPFVVLANRQPGRRSERALASLRELGNIVLLERPLNPETLSSAARAVVRGRQRQYATRLHLADLEASKRTVDELNTELESRIVARTAALADANDRLMREIAERERVQASVVQGQKMEAIGRLTGGMAHDFNNLLHVVNLNLQFILRVAAEGRIADCARRAKEAIARGTRLTAQLLSFARAQSLAPKLQDVNALIANLSELIEVSVGSRVTLVLDLAPEPLDVLLDGAQLEMAVLNMAVNSRDAMPAGGRLTIRTRARAGGFKSGADTDTDPARPSDARGQVEVSVEDDGVGIPPSVLGKVFDPFFTTKPDGQGTGLGLSQVYGFARQSGGSAEVRSTGGRGTTVVLRFPRAERADDDPVAPTTVALEGRPEHEVLVVEDDANVREGIVEGLRLLNYTVREAVDGLAGLQELERRRPSLLLADYLMPGMNGAQLVAAARRLHPGMPILLATGYADMAQVEQVVERRAVLTKPFDLETLAAAVAGELARVVGAAPVPGEVPTPAA